MPTPVTAGRSYPKPHPDNLLSVDVLRLAAALDAIDVDVAAVLAAAVTLTGNQTIAGVKTFSSSPVIPTAAPGDNTTKGATTAFVQAAIAGLIASAPGALDTLNELAAALGNDANFAGTITAALAAKAATVHAHAIADVTGLQSALDAKMSSNLAAFTTAGATTWTCPAGITRAKVTVIGGGGNGGASGTSGAGGGGGAGGCSIKWFNNLAPGTVYNLTVAAQGGVSTFTGPGAVTPTGNAGASGSSAGVTGPAGAGGTAANGDLNLAGQGGCTGYYNASGAVSGAGGASILGGGGRGVTVVSGQVAGVAGGSPGAGGGGAVAVGGTNQSGGAGSAGAVIIEY